MTRFTNRKERKMRFSEFKFWLYGTISVVLMVGGVLSVMMFADVITPLVADGFYSVRTIVAVIVAATYLMATGFFLWKFMSVARIRGLLAGLNRLCARALRGAKEEIRFESKQGVTFYLIPFPDSKIYHLGIGRRDGISEALFLSRNSLSESTDVTAVGSVKLDASLVQLMTTLLQGYVMTTDVDSVLDQAQLAREYREAELRHEVAMAKSMPSEEVERLLDSSCPQLASS